MMTKPSPTIVVGSLALAAAILVPLGATQAPPAAKAPLERAGETHLRNVRQLTDGGENAEAYFSFDGK